MSIGADNSVWFSGNGTVLKLAEHKLVELSPQGMEDLDFRAIHCVNDSTVFLLSAGSPALLLKTTNTGKDWKIVYSDSTETVFYNAIDFWDEQQGVAFGDPENGKFRILRTSDAGETWYRLDSTLCPSAYPKEAGFAASGTNMMARHKDELYYLTGGSHSRLLVSKDKGLSWSSYKLPIRQGKESEGGYSFDISERGQIAIVGGDYTESTNDSSNFCFSKDEGLTWQLAETNPHGYRSCIHYVNDSILFSVGITGIDYSTDKGLNWTSLDTNYNLNVVKFTNGSVGFAAGKGVILEINSR
jgi:photosystem II stability/assembly factor-like uncharacterized protein